MMILNIELMEIKTDLGSMSTNQYWRKHEHKKVNQIWGDFLMSLFKLNMIGILVTEWNIFEKIFDRNQFVKSTERRWDFEKMTIFSELPEYKTIKLNSTGRKS